jgi:hypothetical protein
MKRYAFCLVIITLLGAGCASKPDHPPIPWNKFHPYDFKAWFKPLSNAGLFAKSAAADKDYKECRSAAYEKTPYSTDPSFQREAVEAMAVQCMRDQGWAYTIKTRTAFSQCHAYMLDALMDYEANPLSREAAASRSQELCSPLKNNPYK